MTNGEKIQTILDIDQDCTEVYGKNGMMTFSVPQDWWDAEYEEPTTEYEQKTNKSVMMREIYMHGINMAGEYQGCWVRFKNIEKIVDKYMR